MTHPTSTSPAASPGLPDSPPPRAGRSGAPPRRVDKPTTARSLGPSGDSLWLVNVPAGQLFGNGEDELFGVREAAA